MRKDAGLNGELDLLPQLAWLLFLKAFDDLEEERAIMAPTTLRHCPTHTGGAPGSPAPTVPATLCWPSSTPTSSQRCAA